MGRSQSGAGDRAESDGVSALHAQLVNLLQDELKRFYACPVRSARRGCVTGILRACMVVNAIEPDEVAQIETECDRAIVAAEHRL